MKEIFPEPIRILPEADIPINGLKAFISQADNHQILFMQFDEDASLPEHSHSAQVGFVLDGKIDLKIDGKKHTYRKGDIYSIPAGVKHSGKIYAGYADITFFDQPNRYSQKIKV
ncbi:MAG: cupin [Ignavibacteria bacterium RBG_13_36_8]|nr:MAG: cupin [Ignavibacteria bacterium RBG_13_36_8]